MPSSRGFSRPRDQTRSLASPALVGSFFTTAAPWEALMCRGHAHFGRASLVAQTVKSLSAVWEIRLRSLGREDPLEKEMAPHSSVLAWQSPWTEERGGLQSLGSQRVRHA